MNPNVFGWIPDNQRTPAQQEVAATIVAQMLPFFITGQWRGALDKVVLWDWSKKWRNGKHLPALYQSVGSCVGHGKMKAEWYLLHIQAAKQQRQETPKLLYEPYGYAMSRVCAGISGSEDGSTGSGAAQAAKKYGVLRADFPGLPKPQVEDGSDTLATPGDVDRSWGMRGAPQTDVAEGKIHLVKTTAQVRSASDVAQAIQNLYAVTIASDWGGIEGQQGTVCPLDGNPPVRLNRHSGTWPHQMMISGWWNHPSLGEIFHVDNSWGANAHGDNPDDAPPGGFWITAADVTYIVRQNDSFAYSDVDGFPAPPPELFSWLFA